MGEGLKGVKAEFKMILYSWERLIPPRCKIIKQIKRHVIYCLSHVFRIVSILGLVTIEFVSTEYELNQHKQKSELCNKFKYDENFIKNILPTFEYTKIVLWITSSHHPYL